MDLAILAVLALWPLIQGGLILSQWNWTENADELAWYGAAAISISIGVGLFASRYFAGTYFSSVVLANIALMLSASLFLNGIIVGDGRPARLIYLYAPAMIWGGATQLDYMKQNIEARVWLSCLLILAVSASGAAYVFRSGLRLRGRQILSGFWLALIAAILMKMMFIPEISADTAGRYIRSPAHFIYYILVIASIILVHLYVLLRAHSLRDKNLFTSTLARAISNNAIANAREKNRFHRDVHVWSLRLDPLAHGANLTDKRLAGAATAVAKAIRSHCQPVHAAVRAGADRVLWLSDHPLTDRPIGSEPLTADLIAIAQKHDFPAIPMTLGVSPVGDRSILVAGAEADRRGVMFTDKGQRSAVAVST